MRRQDRQPPKTKKYFRSTKSGAGMTKAGVARYRREKIKNLKHQWIKLLKKIKRIRGLYNG